MGFEMRGFNNSQPVPGATCEQILATPATGTLDDFAPGGGSQVNYRNCNVLEINAIAAVTLNSLAGGLNGRRLKILNVGAASISIAADGGGEAENQFNFSATLEPGTSIALMYSATLARWTASNGAGSAAASSGSWVPVLTPGGNVAAADATSAHYTRIGDIVSYCIQGTATLTDPALPGGFTFSLPVAATPGPSEIEGAVSGYSLDFFPLSGLVAGIDAAVGSLSLAAGPTNTNAAVVWSVSGQYEVGGA